MKALPPNLILEKNKTATDSAWLVLLEIMLNDDDSTVLRFVRNNENIVFGNEVDSSLIAHWKMNDIEPDQVVVNSVDTNDNGETSANNTEDLTDDGAGSRTGSSLNLGGTDHITVGDDAKFSFGDGSSDSPFSIAIPVFYDGSAGTQGIITKYDSGGDKEWYLMLSSGKIQFVLYDDSVPALIHTTTDSAMTSPAWHYIVATYDGSGTPAGLNIYIDGELIASTDVDDVSYVAMESLGTDVKIGIFASGGGLFEEKLDDARIYDRELLQVEVTALYNDGNGTELSEPFTYTAFPFLLGPTKNMSKGQIPTVTLSVGNITGLLEPYLKELAGAVGSTVKITVVNSENLTEDYIELELNYDVLATNSSSQWVDFILGAPSPLRQRYPLLKYTSLHCGFQFKDVEDQVGPRCSYVPKVITAITQAAEAKISVAGHGFAAGDVMKFAEVIDMTEINGLTGTIQDADPDVDGDAFTVDINSSAFTAYDSAGIVGYATCLKTLSQCRQRTNSPHFGGVPGIRSGTVRIA